MKSQIIIVDSNDKPIDLKGWGSFNKQDIYRVSALLLTDRASGNILIAQRKYRAEFNDPGKWMISAVAGTLEAGETYEANISKETEEEIGLIDVEFSPGPKYFVDDGTHTYFCKWFWAQTDKDCTHFTLQEDEVEATKWISKADLLENVAKYPEQYVASVQTALQVLDVTPTQLNTTHDH